MRIGLRVAPRSSGGGKAFVNNLASALADATGQPVPLFVMGPDGGQYEGEHRIQVTNVDDPVRRRVLGPRALAQAVERTPVDMIVAPGTEVTAVDGVPSVLWPLTVAPFEESARRVLGDSLRTRARWKALQVAIGRAAGQADGFVFSSHYTRALYRECVPGIRSAPTAVIPPAPTLLQRSASPQPSPHSRPYLLFVSHLYPYKMVVEMVEGFARAVRRGVAQDLLIVGNAVNEGYAQRIRTAVDRQGVGDRVVLVGGVAPENLAAFYEHADLFIFPSISENAGSFAVIDAFRAGLPVVSSGMSSMTECCQDAARYFDPREPDHLADVLVETLSDADLLGDLARRSRLRGQSFPVWDDVARGMVTFCEALAAGTLGSRP